MTDEQNFRFCTQCGVIDTCDEDGSCPSCGCDTCTVADVTEFLRRWRNGLPGEPETLTHALASLGLSLGRPGGAGRYQLRRGSVDVGTPICASAGWKLVSLLRRGLYTTTAEAIEKATELAAADAIGAPYEELRGDAP